MDASKTIRVAMQIIFIFGRTFYSFICEFTHIFMKCSLILYSPQQKCGLYLCGEICINCLKVIMIGWSDKKLHSKVVGERRWGKIISYCLNVDDHERSIRLTTEFMNVL